MPSKRFKSSSAADSAGSALGAAAASAAADRPISAGEFASAIKPLVPDHAGPVAVAVSGGADSMALMLLAAAWCKSVKHRLIALTVDHQLRPGSTDEASAVARWSAALGVEHHILTWAGGGRAAHAGASVETAAREARYKLLADYCRGAGVGRVLLAHHADDQVETFWMRLSRGSGLSGLAAMRPAAVRDGIALVRPLLGFEKERLVATCRASGQEWVEDPSNADPRHARARFRQARALLEAEGLTRDRLLATIAHLARAQQAIDTQVLEMHRAACIWNAYGVATIDVIRLRSAPAEVALRVLSQVLAFAGGEDYGPRFESLDAVWQSLMTGEMATRTLHGCVMTRAGAALTVFREAGRITADANFSHHGIAAWDGRFQITCQNRHGRADFAAFSVTALTNEEWIGLKRDIASPEFVRLAPSIRQTLPAVRDKYGVAAIPHAGFVRPDLSALEIVFEASWLGREREPFEMSEPVAETS